MLASKYLSPVCNTKPKLDASNAGNLHGNLPVVESLGGVHERTIQRRMRASFFQIVLTTLIAI